MLKSLNNIVSRFSLMAFTIVMVASFSLPAFINNSYSAGEAPTINGMLNATGEKAGYQKYDDQSIPDGAYPMLVGRFIGIFLGIIGVIFTILVVYAGYLWMSAQGDAAALTKAKDIMTRAVIGLVVVVSAYIITYFVTMALTQGNYLI